MQIALDNFKTGEEKLIEFLLEKAAREKNVSIGQVGEVVITLISGRQIDVRFILDTAQQYVGKGLTGGCILVLYIPPLSPIINKEFLKDDRVIRLIKVPKNLSEAKEIIESILK